MKIGVRMCKRRAGGEETKTLFSTTTTLHGFPHLLCSAHPASFKMKMSTIGAVKCPDSYSERSLWKLSRFTRAAPQLCDRKEFFKLVQSRAPHKRNMQDHLISHPMTAHFVEVPSVSVRSISVDSSTLHAACPTNNGTLYSACISQVTLSVMRSTQEPRAVMNPT